MEKDDKTPEKKSWQIQEFEKKQLVSPEIDAIPQKNPVKNDEKGDPKKKE